MTQNNEMTNRANAHTNRALFVVLDDIGKTQQVNFATIKAQQSAKQVIAAPNGGKGVITADIARTFVITTNDDPLPLFSEVPSDNDCQNIYIVDTGEAKRIPDQLISESVTDCEFRTTSTLASAEGQLERWAYIMLIKERADALRDGLELAPPRRTLLHDKRTAERGAVFPAQQGGSAEQHPEIILEALLRDRFEADPFGRVTNADMKEIVEGKFGQKSKTKNCFGEFAQNDFMRVLKKLFPNVKSGERVGSDRGFHGIQPSTAPAPQGGAQPEAPAPEQSDLPGLPPSPPPPRPRPPRRTVEASRANLESWNNDPTVKRLRTERAAAAAAAAAPAADAAASAE